MSNPLSRQKGQWHVFHSKLLEWITKMARNVTYISNLDATVIAFSLSNNPKDLFQTRDAYRWGHLTLIVRLNCGETAWWISLRMKRWSVQCLLLYKCSLSKRNLWAPRFRMVMSLTPTAITWEERLSTWLAFQSVHLEMTTNFPYHWHSSVSLCLETTWSTDNS